MPKTTATYCDVPHVDGRIFSLDDCHRLIRLIGGHVVMGLGAVAAVGMLVTTVTFVAAWIVNTVVATNPSIRASAPAGPGSLALVQDAPNFANAPAVTFADRWPRPTASMQASVMPLLPPHPLEIADNVPVPPKPERATSVPLPRPHPTQHDIPFAPVGQIGPQVAPQVAPATPPPAPPADKRAAPQEAHNKSLSLSLPAPDSRTAVYDIVAHTVYLP